MKSEDINIDGLNNQVNIDASVITEKTSVYIKGNNNTLNIAKNCVIKESVFFFEGDNCEITLGEGTTVESAAFVVFEKNNKIITGNDCMFARDITVRTSDSHSIIDLKSKKRINPAKSIFIGNHVWVCAHAHILKGVSIGDNSIIALGCVVSHDVPGSCIAGCNPNKVIRKNITWDRGLIT